MHGAFLQMDGALVSLHGPGSREQQREDAHGWYGRSCDFAILRFCDLAILRFCDLAILRSCDLLGFTRKLSLTSFSLRQFKDIVFTPFKDSLVSFIHDLVTRDREGDVVDR